MLESKCTVLAIEAHRTLFAEKEKVLELAEREGIVILAVEQGSL